MHILNLGATHFVGALRAQGHTVLSAGYWSSCDIQIHHPTSALRLYERITQRGFVPHVAVVNDNGNLPCFPGVEELPCPTIFYSIDTFCNPWHVPYGYAFDHVLVAQKDYLNFFVEEHIPHSWFPLFAREGSDLNKEPFNTRPHPVVFVGTLKSKNLPKRETFLKEFQQKHPLLIAQGEYVSLYNQSQMVLNNTAAGEVNFRCFEAMACGCALLMESCPNGLTDLFTVGEHILPLFERNNALQATIIARNALNNPKVLERIAAQGYEEVRKKHMDSHRATHMVRIFEELIARQAHKERLKNLAHRRRLLSTAYAILAAELTASEYQEHRQHFQQLYDAMKSSQR